MVNKVAIRGSLHSDYQMYRRLVWWFVTNKDQWQENKNDSIDLNIREPKLTLNNKNAMITMWLAVKPNNKCIAKNLTYYHSVFTKFEHDVGELILDDIKNVEKFVKKDYNNLNKKKQILSKLVPPAIKVSLKDMEKVAIIIYELAKTDSNVKNQIQDFLINDKFFKVAQQEIIIKVYNKQNSTFNYNVSFIRGMQNKNLREYFKNFFRILLGLNVTNNIPEWQEESKIVQEPVQDAPKIQARNTNNIKRNLSSENQVIMPTTVVSKNTPESTPEKPNESLNTMVRQNEIETKNHTENYLQRQTINLNHPAAESATQSIVSRLNVPDEDIIEIFESTSSSSKLNNLSSSSRFLILKQENPGSYIREITSVKREIEIIQIEDAEEERPSKRLSVRSPYNINRIDNEAKKENVVQTIQQTYQQIRIKNDKTNKDNDDVEIIEELENNNSTLAEKISKMIQEVRKPIEKDSLVVDNTTRNMMGQDLINGMKEAQMNSILLSIAAKSTITPMLKNVFKTAVENVLQPELEKLVSNIQDTFVKETEKTLLNLNPVVNGLQLENALDAIQANVLKNQIMDDPNAGALPPPSIEEELEKQIRLFAGTGEYYIAFQQALNNDNSEILLNLCEMVNPICALGNQGDPQQSKNCLSPKLILVLMDKLAQNLEERTDIKEKWILAAINYIDPRDPSIQQDLVKYLPSVNFNLANFISNNKNHPLANNFNVISLAISYSLTKCMPLNNKL